LKIGQSSMVNAADEFFPCIAALNNAY